MIHGDEGLERKLTGAANEAYISGIEESVRQQNNETQALEGSGTLQAQVVSIATELRERMYDCIRRRTFPANLTHALRRKHPLISERTEFNNVWRVSTPLILPEVDFTGDHRITYAWRCDQNFMTQGDPRLNWSMTRLQTDRIDGYAGLSLSGPLSISRTAIIHSQPEHTEEERWYQVYPKKMESLPPANDIEREVSVAAITKHLEAAKGNGERSITENGKQYSLDDKDQDKQDFFSASNMQDYVNDHAVSAGANALRHCQFLLSKALMSIG